MKVSMSNIQVELKVFSVENDKADKRAKWYTDRGWTVKSCVPSSIAGRTILKVERRSMPIVSVEGN